MNRQIEELIQKPEGAKLEFKENIKAEDSIIATIIAFANGSGGKIVIGVNDKTRYIVGVAEPHKVGEILANKIYDIIEPRILPNIETIPYRNTYLVVIEISPSQLRPHFKKAKGKEASTYIRIGSTTRLADQDLLKVIERSAAPRAFDEELCYEAQYEEINCTVASQLLKHKRDLQPNDLVSLGVFIKNGNVLLPTIGGMILFGVNRLHYFPDAYLQIGAFAGNTKSKIIDTQNITSFLPNLVDEALNFLRRHISVNLKIDEVRHQEVWEIPKIALREAIINAIVHTDYSLTGVPIRIAIFDDRIAIENSALLLGGFTFEELKAGISKIRNPVIAGVFKEIGLIERWGSGIERMITTCEDAGLKTPVFEEIGSRIRVTFYRQKIAEVVVEVKNEIDQLIIGLLTFYGALPTNQIATCVNKSKRTVINRLAGLINKGKVVEISQGLNDPKKRYSLIGNEINFNKQMTLKVALDNCIILKKQNITKVAWGYEQDKTRQVLKLDIAIEEYIISFIFTEEVIADYFLNYSSNKQEWQIKALEVVTNLFVTAPIFSQIFLKALSWKKIRQDLKTKKSTRVNIRKEDFNLKDFRI